MITNILIIISSLFYFLICFLLVYYTKIKPKIELDKKFKEEEKRSEINLEMINHYYIINGYYRYYTNHLMKVKRRNIIFNLTKEK